MTLIDQAKALAHGAEFLVVDWLGTGATAVPATHAQERANICLAGCNGGACPHNQKGSVLARTAAKGIKRIARLKNKLQMRVTGERSLGECAICNCVLNLKIWIPINQLYEEMSDDEFDKLPDYCWVKQEVIDVIP